MFVTMVEGAVETDRVDDLQAAWETNTTSVLPPGLIESSLLSSEEGTWRIVTVWESQEAVIAMRASTATPTALVIFQEAGARPTVSMWTVESRVTA